jgi:uncharacterized protein (UPF0332 family)
LTKITLSIEFIKLGIGGSISENSTVMDANHILKLRSNPYQLIKCLDSILPVDQTDLIRLEIYSNVKQLIRLAQSHLRFAKATTGKECWRQKVSRSYFACYLASRAIRLAISGQYNTDIKDHKNIGELPDDFPSVSTWQNFFITLRADRNMADYDHTAKTSSLEMSSTQYIDKTANFIMEVKLYLQRKGVI